MMEGREYEREINYARLAAYIDADGSIIIEKRRAEARYDLRLKVTNTDMRLLIWIKENFGGGIYPKGKPKKKWHKEAYDWEVVGFDAYKLIKEVRRFLIIKGEQAEVAKEFYKRCKKISKQGCRRSLWMIKRQEQYYQQMTGLNKRGVDDNGG